MQHETIAPAAEAAPSFSIERDAAHAAVKLLASRVAERRNTIPILSCLLIDASPEGFVRFTATDLDLQASIRVPAAVDQPGRFCVDATALLDTLAKLDKGAVPLFAMNAERLSIDAGRARFTLATLKPVDFPVIAPPADDERIAAFDLDAAQLAGDLAALQPAIGGDEVRTYLNGVAFERRAGDPALILFATDGHVLVKVERPAPAGTDALGSIIVPSKYCDVLQRALKTAAGMVAIEIDGRRVVARVDGVELIGKLVDGTYPDWRRVIGVADDAAATLLPTLELEPRLPLRQVAALSKPLGAGVEVAVGRAAARLTHPDRPEWLGVVMLLAGAADGLNGWSYGHGGDSAAASAYLSGLARAAGLPVDPDHIRLVRGNGRYLGATFGEHVDRPAWTEEVLCYESFTSHEVHHPAEKGWSEGSYSVAMPAARFESIAADLTVECDGVTYPLRGKSHAIELSAAAVRALCGPVDPSTFRAIPAFVFHHGRILAPGMRLPEQARVRNGRRSRPLTDREALAAYCRDPAGTLAALQPVPIAAVGPEPESAPLSAAPAERHVSPRAAGIDPVEADSPTDVAIQAEPESNVIVVPAGRREDHARGSDAVESPPSAELAELQLRIAMLESAFATMQAAGSDSPIAPVVQPDCNQRSPARLRMIRRYLAMRAERALLREELAAQRAENAAAVRFWSRAVQRRMAAQQLLPGARARIARSRLDVATARSEARAAMAGMQALSSRADALQARCDELERWEEERSPFPPARRFETVR